MEDTLKFQEFNSFINVSFWQELTKLKLDVWKLNSEPCKLSACFRTGNPDRNDIPGQFIIEGDAFNADFNPPARHYESEGTLYNTNTIEDFKELDVKEFFRLSTEKIWNAICSGEIFDNPTLLNQFLILSFADLKKYKYYHRVAFPALSLSNPAILTKNPELITSFFTEKQLEFFTTKFGEQKTSPVFLVQRNGENLNILKFSEFKKIIAEKKWNNDFFLGFCDSSNLEKFPGWNLRNLLMSVWYHFSEHISTIQILAVREGENLESSLVFSVKIPKQDQEPNSKNIPKSSGWEKNSQRKIGGVKIVDLAQTMDKTKLATTSVDLNLKLMKWRLLPNIDLEKISETKCLLLGSGTLGCNISRCLIGWGIRNISFVDNGTVSLSNPVRQSLYDFQDSISNNGSGVEKAPAAAKKIKQIFPECNANGYTLHMNMPGHKLTNEKKEQKDFEKLKTLINEHDVIFLLTDSRESRWLPSILAADQNKITITVAVGLDTFVVMRHGHTPNFEEEESKSVNNDFTDFSRLGCYFCNDVVAPTDSLAARTLDQQCTVARPGLSFVASGLAAELTVSLITHELGIEAPAENELQNSNQNDLGILPHQIRGFLSQFSNMNLTGSAYSQCTACSKTVIETYRKEGWEFLKRVFDNPTHLEDITGLAELSKEKVEWEIDEEGWDIDDDDF